MVFAMNQIFKGWWKNGSKAGTVECRQKTNAAIVGATSLMRSAKLQGLPPNSRSVKVYKNRRKNLTKAEKIQPESADWPSMFSTVQSFNPAVVPLPVRMGRVRPNKLGDIPPAAQGNIEVLKIPTFLHLTPPAIQRHCEALKPFCTSWPSTLKEKPIRIVSNNYLYSGPSIRHPESRKVTLKVCLAELDLDHHAYMKLIFLAGSQRYCSNTNELSITVDRCPTRVQNIEYALYLLTALYQQSWNTELWENEKPEFQSDKDLQNSIADLLKLKIEGKDKDRKIGNQRRVIASKLVRFNRQGKSFIIENEKYGIRGPPTKEERILLQEEWENIKP